MAVLASTKLGPRFPQGKYVEQEFSVDAATGVAQADEFIATGFTELLSVVGWHYEGTGAAASQADAPIFVLNAEGSGQTAGDHPGQLGIESVAAIPADATNTLHVTLRAKL